MIITRTWAMPNSNTFSIKPIKELIEEVFAQYTEPRAVDPFARNSLFADRCITNDLDTEIEADYHMDALDFLKILDSDSADIVLFDPPYSPRQITECYKKMGLSVNMQTTQASFWSNLKKEIERIIKPNGTAITCGWNSGGVGVKYGFQIEKILLVPHGGWHNDTIVTVERSTK